MKKRIISWLLALSMMIGWLPASVFAVDTANKRSVDTMHYYYNQLSDMEKVLYDGFVANAKTLEPVSVVNSDGYEEHELCQMATKAYSALVADQPLYHMYIRSINTCTLDSDTQVFTVYWNVMDSFSAYLVQKVEARIQQYSDTVGKNNSLYTRFGKLMLLLMEHTEYDPYYAEYGEIKLSLNDSVLGGLGYGAAVCAGLSQTVKVMCDALDIPCIIVGNAGHAWTYIQMDDGQWYAIDPAQIVERDSIPNSFTHQENMLPVFLLGYDSDFYRSNTNMWISELYIGSPGWFTFPELAREQYETSEPADFSYQLAASPFQEWEKQFVYQVNEDGQTCTITDYYGPQNGSLVIPGKIDGYSVTAIGEAAFYHRDGFTGDLILPDSVTYIGVDAFQSCGGLRGTLHLPSNLEYIDTGAFVGCENLSGTLSFPKNLRVIQHLAFFDCGSLTGDILLPEKLEYLGQNVFWLCTGLTGTLYIPDRLIWDPKETIRTCFQSYSVSDTNSHYAVIDGVLYSKDKTELISCPQKKAGMLRVPDGVTRIGDYACYVCTGLTGIELPGTLRYIGERAFDTLILPNKTLTIPNSVVEIGASAFSGSFFNGNLIIPDSVTKIGECAFAFSTFKGHGLKLSSNIEVIPDKAFFGAELTNDIVIPDSVKEIGAHAFDPTGYMTEDRKLVLPDSIAVIGESAFANCGFTGELVIPEGTEIGANAFEWNNFDYFSCSCPSGYEHVTDGDRIVHTCLNCRGSYSTSAKPFTDVSADAYYANAVTWAVSNNITAGTSDTTFSPNATCTRGQVVAFLWRAAGRPEPKNSQNPFTDVKAGDYYYKAVLWAVENGVVYGTSSTTFSPGQGCTRGQVAAFLWRAAGRPEPETNNNPFLDVSASAYYNKAVIWAAENKIVYGTGASQFSPEISCSRGQIVSFLYRTYGK